MKRIVSLILSVLLLVGCFSAEVFAVEPTADTKLKAYNVNGGIKLTWDEVEGAESYRVYRKIPGGSWKSLKKDLTGLSYTDASVEFGETYQYSLRVYTEEGGGYAYSKAVIRISQPKAEATNLYNGIEISWNETDYAQSYSVYRRLPGGSWKFIKNTTKTEYLDKTAQEGVKYQYTVRAKHEDCLSSNYKIVTVQRMAKPDPTRYNVYEGIKIEWDAVEGADSYRVYRKTPGGSLKSLKRGIEGLSYVDTTAVEGEVYQYAVRSYDSTGGSPYSYTSEVTRILQPEVKAQNKIAGVKLTWDKVDYADSYSIYRRLPSGSWKFLDNITGSVFTDKTAVSGTKYQYVVRAKKGSVLSSNKYRDTIIRLETPETTATNVNSGVSVKWDAIDGAKSYRVYRKPMGGSYTLLQKGVTSTSYTDTTATSGKKYIYAVRSWCDSELSSYGAADVKQYMARPTLTATTLSTSSVKLSWNAVGGAEEYKVYRKNSEGEWKVIATVEGTSYTIKGMDLGESHSYSVRAIGELNNSARSASKTGKATYPAVSFELKLDPGYGVNIKWNKVSGAGSYRVYRKTEGGEWKILKTTTGTSYTDTSGEPGRTYYYTVRAFEKSGGNGVLGIRSSGESIVFSKVDPNKPMIALTFDDGPSYYTPEILDCLERYDARATFFVVGDRVSSYSSYIKRAHDMGCEIGNHSWSHPLLTSLSVSQLLDEIESTDEAIEKITGEKPRLLRPTYGGVNSTVSNYAGKPLINWSVDTLDWETQSSTSTYNSIMSSGDGSIVLMHDLYYATKEGVLRAVPELVSRGYQLVTVSELAAYRGVDMKDGEVYYSFRP